MVVHDFNVLDIAVHPNEADSPLIIDPNTMLSASLTPQRFQPIGRRYTQVDQGSSIIQHSEFTR